MHIRRFFLLAMTGLALCGCTTMTPADRRAADEKTCLSYGFRPHTDGLATCLQRMDLDRRAESRAFRYGSEPMYWGWNRPAIIR